MRGILPLSDKKFEILQQKHSEACEASDEIILKETPKEVHPAIYENMNSEMQVLQDADGWHLILILGNFGNVEQDLRKSVAEMAKRLCQEKSANYLAIFLACKLAD